jgi:pimeloyl-ACP methyl ester carboxylesterase
MRSYSPYSLESFVCDARISRIASVIRLVALASIFSFAAAETGFAQPPKKPAFEEKTLITDDNVELKITYFKSSSGKDAAVVVMLHGKGGSRLQYKKFAQELQVKGDFAVITVDLRGHGDSSQAKKGELKKADYQAMVTQDLDAVRDFIFDEHQKEQLNMNKLGIVACEFSASVALVYTELDWEKQPYDDSPVASQRTPRGQDVHALALISPDTSTPGLFANNAASALRGLPDIAVMIGASEKEKNGRDLAMAKKLFEQISLKRDKDERLYLQPYPGAVRGMDLILQDANLRAHIVAFLDKHLKGYPSEWRDRRSRLDRD